MSDNENTPADENSASWTVDEQKVDRPDRRMPTLQKKKRPVWLPVLVILTACLGLTLYLLLVNEVVSDKQEPSAAEPTVRPETILDANGIIEVAKPLFGEAPSEDTFNLAPILKPSGYDFFVSPSSSQDGKTVSVDLPLAEARGIASQMGIDLLQRGMIEKKLEPEAETPWGVNSSATNYSNEFADCQISVFGISEGVYRLAIGCMNKTDYTKLAKEVEPFYGAYIASSAEKSGSVIAFSAPDIRQSRTKDYQLAELDSFSVVNGVATSGAKQLFYKLPSGEWRHFLSSQSLLGCNQFDTKELREAYLGEACVGETGGVTTVSL